MAYVTIRRQSRQRADWRDADEQPVLSRKVVVVDDEPINTGLLDLHGTPIYRTADKIKMGFV